MPTKVQNTLISLVQLLIDPSSRIHGMILWLQMSHNVILQLQFIFAI